MADITFIDGMSVKVQTTQYGQIVNLGFNLEKFNEFAKKHKTENGWLNVSLKNSRNGLMYACLSVSQKQEANNENSSSEELGEEEIPF